MMDAGLWDLVDYLVRLDRLDIFLFPACEYLPSHTAGAAILSLIPSAKLDFRVQVHWRVAGHAY